MKARRTLTSSLTRWSHVLPFREDKEEEEEEEAEKEEEEEEEEKARIKNKGIARGGKNQ